MFNSFTDFDPAKAAAGGVPINDYVYERLYKADPFATDSRVVPELATAPLHRLDDTTYRTPLRASVTFHDGSRTADDVAFSLQRVLDPATGLVSRDSSSSSARCAPSASTRSS